MALEQWEIDLRNQLSGISVTPAPAPIPTKVVTTHQRVPKWLLVVFILAMSAGTVYNYCLKTGRTIQWPDFVEHISHLRHDFTNQATVLTAAIADLQKKVGDLSDKTTQNSERMALLGALHNEQEVARSRGDASTILINYDWSINKMPKYLDLTPESRANLQKQVKP